MDNFKLNHWIIDVNARLISIQKNHESSAQVLSHYQMAVLVILAKNPNKLISIKQMLAQLQQQQSLLVPEEQVKDNQQHVITTIEQLKKQLEVQDKAMELIIGNPDIGYRLTAEPEPLAQPQSRQGSINAFAFQQHNAQAKHNVFSSAGLIALITFIVIITTLAFIGLSYNDPATAVSNYNNNNINEQTISRVAVIPFTNKSEDGDDEYLGDGIAQELINSLASLTTIDVLARASSFAYKGQRMNPYQIGSRLNAKYVLKGSVKKNKQQISVTMQLLWVKNNIEVWSKTYSQPYSELLNLQRKMFTDISKQLKLPLPIKMLLPSSTQTNDNRYGQRRIEAYHHFLVAQSLSQKTESSQLIKAVNRYNQAISEDATFALAYAHLAKVNIKQWQLGYIGRSNAQRKAQVSLDKAFLLSPNLPEAYLTKGILFAVTKQPLAAVENFRRAIDLRANYADAHLYLGIELQKRSLFNQANDTINRAIALDPNNTNAHRHAAINQLSMGELEPGIKHLVKTIDQTSTETDVELTLSQWYNEFGYQDKAHQWATLALSKNPQDPLTHIALALSANSDELSKQHLEQIQLMRQNEKLYFNQIAQVYYQRGQISNLRQHVKQHLYTSQGKLNSGNNQQSLFWAGIVHISDRQYSAAANLYEMMLGQYKSRSEHPEKQIKLSNLLAYCYKKLNNSNKMAEMLKRSKRVQSDLIRNGLKTPTFVIEMVAYYTIANEQNKAEQLLRNATSKGWKLETHIQSNPIFELLSTRQKYIIQ